MDPLTVGYTCVGLLVGALAIGIPVAAAMGLVGVGGMIVAIGEPFAFGQLQTLPYEVTSNYAYAVLPLFVLLGTIAGHSGITSELFEAGNAWLRRTRGGLYMAVIFGSASFSAISGSAGPCTTQRAGEAAIVVAVAAGIVASGAEAVGSSGPPQPAMTAETARNAGIRRACGRNVCELIERSTVIIVFGLSGGATRRGYHSGRGAWPGHADHRHDVVAPRIGFEPMTFRLGGGRSIP